MSLHSRFRAERCLFFGTLSENSVGGEIGRAPSDLRSPSASLASEKFVEIIISTLANFSGVREIAFKVKRYTPGSRQLCSFLPKKLTNTVFFEKRTTQNVRGERFIPLRQNWHFRSSVERGKRVLFCAQRKLKRISWRVPRKLDLLTSFFHAFRDSWQVWNFVGKGR